MVTLSSKAAEWLQNPEAAVAEVDECLGPGEGAVRFLCERAVRQQRAWMTAHEIRHGRGTKRSLTI